jgi:TonB-linked SusC/RagA family outer membrane protein
VLTVVGAVVCLAAAAPPLHAQEAGVIGGTVLTEGTLQPLAGVQVTVNGTELGALTDASGSFHITGASGGQVELHARRIGYRPATVTARVGQTDVRITMAARAVELNQVVVTGTPGGTESRAIGNAVSQIKASDIVATQPVQNLQQLLNGRATGVAVIAGSGQVGTGSRVRIRGATSLSLTADPLIYVDGVRVDNAQATGPLSQGFGSRSVSRWNDFNPEDIESIEVIKGPAAATLYGTEAANGVIQIITKRGSTGAPTWTASARTGVQRFYDYEDRLYTNYGVNPLTGQLDSLNISKLEKERGNPDIWRTGRSDELNLSVGGGSQQFRYYAGLGAENSTGADRANKLTRYNGRVNLSLTPSEKWDLSASLGYTTGRTNLPLEAGGGGATWTTYWGNPTTLDDPRRGFYSGTPEQYTEGFEIFQDADRFTGSVTFNHRPASWFNHRIIVGTDVLAEDNQEIGQRNDALSIFGLDGPNGGYMEVSTRNVTYNTFDYVANATFSPHSDWQLTSSLGAQYYARSTQSRGIFGEGFPAPGLKSIAALSSIDFDEDDLIENNTVGVFFQEQFAWRNRVFLTGAVRADDNSAFGENFDLVYYPKGSLSWVISEEPFFQLPWVSALKLRAAYGQSGLQPAALTAIPTFVPGGAGTVTPGNIGNEDLGPERSDEMELGLDVGLLQDRLGVEFTYFGGTTRDAILARGVPPSSGFGGTQFFNAGRITRSGLELLLRGSPVQRENFGWDMTFSISTNSNEIKDLGAVDTVSLGSNEAHVVGYPVGSWFSRRLVSAEFDPVTKEAFNLMCDNGTGGTVACSSAPRVFLGNTAPETEGAFTTTFTFMKNFRLNALVDFKAGYKKLDGNERVRCYLFAVCRENFFPEEFDPVHVARVQNGSSFIDEYTQDASYTKLREVALTYSLPQSVAARVGMNSGSVTLAGRNLLTWTDYKGLEPEASFIGGSRGSVGQFEQNVLPQLQTWVLSFNIGF